MVLAVIGPLPLISMFKPSPPRATEILPMRVVAPARGAAALFWFFI
jgi:hypothetical protein